MRRTDGAGNIEVALDIDDGILGPLGGNNIAYDTDGNFYVVNDANRTILRFPAGGGPRKILGDLSDGIHGRGPIALAPNGNLYYATQGSSISPEILRFTGPHQAEVFDTLPEGTALASLAIDSSANIFALTNIAVYRYEAGDPSTRELIAELGVPTSWSSMTFSADESLLYVAVFDKLFAVDPVSGAVTELGIIESGVGPIAGTGIAVYVPEPGTLVSLLVGLAAGVRPRR